MDCTSTKIFTTLFRLTPRLRRMTQMKIFTYLRTLLPEFWAYLTTAREAKVEPYWMPMVEHNLPSIAKDLGIETLQPENWPRNEEEAKALYLKWCQKTDVPETKTQDR